MRICKADDCTREHVCQGYCGMHYKRLIRSGELSVIVKPSIEKIPGEKWATIKKHENYKISTHGRVKSVITDKLIKIQKSKIGGYKTHLRRGNSIRIHMEMARAFLENPYNDKKAIFKDGNADNLLLSNIEWFTVYRKQLFFEMIDKNKDNENVIAIVDFINGKNSKLNKIIDKNYDDFKMAATGRIRKYAIAPSLSIVDDCVQHGLLKAMEALKKGTLKDVSNLNGWISTIIRNTTVNYLLESNKRKSESQVNKDGKIFSIFENTC